MADFPVYSGGLWVATVTALDADGASRLAAGYAYVMPYQTLTIRDSRGDVVGQVRYPPMTERPSLWARFKAIFK